jgi:hypothetical protein
LRIFPWYPNLLLTYSFVTLYSSFLAKKLKKAVCFKEQFLAFLCI